jgi:hypothetical protein
MSAWHFICSSDAQLRRVELVSIVPCRTKSRGSSKTQAKGKGSNVRTRHAIEGLRCPVHVFRSSVFVVLAAALSGPQATAQTALPPITVGAGVQSSFAHTDPDPGDGTDDFLLNSVRLYVSGSATEHFKLMFNTEYNGAQNDVEVLDAAAQLVVSSKFNVWFGRFLPPSDRANLYGPYYSHHWAVFQDGVQDGYPFIFQGRANGAMYWGQFGKVKLSGGAFDGSTLNGDDTVLTAARAQVDFWDAEDGYYLNGTYYGDKNLLALGAAIQAQGSDKTAYNVDFLMERKISGGGVFSVEAEWARYDHLGGYDAGYGLNDGGYVLGAYMFPTVVGVGRFELLGKYASARFREGLVVTNPDYDQKTTEIDFNYVIRQFNARVMVFYKDTRFDAVRTDFKQFGVGLQLQI